MSYEHHPVLDLEPLPDDSMSAMADVLRLILDETFRTPKKGAASCIESAFRRFAALTWLLRPDLVDGCSQTALAEQLGISRARMSVMVLHWSDQFGITNGGLKSTEARETYRQIQLGHPGHHNAGTLRASPIGTARISTSAAKAEERRLARARQQLLTQGTWPKLDRELLNRRNYIDDSGVLTDQGKQWIESGDPG